MPIRSIRDITAFGPRFLVVCPRCSKRADLRKRDNPAVVALDCPSCDYQQQWQPSQIGLASGWRWLGNMGHSVPAGFGGDTVETYVETSPDATQQSQGLTLRLWLQTPCQGENLWFLNREHLDFVEQYLQMSAQERHLSFDEINHRKQIQWIEPWMKRAENRDAIIESVRKLRRERGTPF